MSVLTLPHVAPTFLGHVFGDAVTDDTITESGSTLWTAISFVCPPFPNANNWYWKDFHCIVKTATGSPKLTASLYSDNAGSPNAAIDAGQESGVLSAGFNQLLGKSSSPTTLTPGTLYWIVIKCTSGTSAAVTTHRTSTGYGWMIYDTSFNAYWTSHRTTWNGSAWNSTRTYGVTGFRIGFSDGTDDAYYGLPTNQTSATAASGNKLGGTGSDEYGISFTTPAGPSLKVRGIMTKLHKAGTGQDPLRYRIYDNSGPTLLATTLTCPDTNILSGSYVPLLFSSVVTLAPSTTYRIMVGVTGTTSTATNYFDPIILTVHADANSRALIPFGMYTYYKNTNSGTWSTQGADTFSPFLLMLDYGGEFSVAAGGSGGSYGY